MIAGINLSYNTPYNDSSVYKKQDPTLKALKRAGIEECETCKNRKYQDGSNEMVSFKSAACV